MPPRRDEFSVRQVATSMLLGLTAIASLFLVDAEAQTEPPPLTTQSSGSEPATQESFPPSARAAASEARRVIENAFADEGGGVRWNALRAARHLGEPWIAGVVLPLCESPDLTERVLALEVVTNTNPSEGRDAFLSALSSEHRSIRLRGLLGLAALRDDSMVPVIATIMYEDSDPDLQAAAARALGEIGRATASIPLYEAVMDSPHAPVREQAVISLLALGEAEVGRFLVENVSSQRGPGEAEILKLLALVPDPSLIAGVAPFLEHESPQVRIQAAATILSILDRSRPPVP